MKTIVLDDDPTGTQSATGVTVLLEWDADTVSEVLAGAGSVYLQTNSRALDERSAVALARRIRDEGAEVSVRLGEPVRYVLRGDSTLRGHVFAETEVFLGPGGADGVVDAEDAVMLFAPAFPDGGRTTRGGVHFVRLAGEDVPAAETEYAQDPVFPFADSALADYVAAKSGRRGIPVTLAEVRDGGVARALESARPGDVVLPDAVEQADIEAIAAAVRAAEDAGRRVVVRSAAPLAAALAGVTSAGLLPTPLVPEPVPTLLAVGSHTAGASAQLAAIAGAPAEVSTEAALADPITAGRDAAARARTALESGGLAIVATERRRRSDHGTLDHGERVMAGLCAAVRDLLPDVGVVVAKGGITSNEVARAGIGARGAEVLGQVLPGVSVWRLTAHDGRELLYVVVPGNVGGPDTLERVLRALGIRTSVQAGVGAAARG